MIAPTDPLAEAIRAEPDERLARTLVPHALRFARQVLGAVDPHLIQTAAHDAISLSVEEVAREADRSAAEWLEPTTVAGAWAELQAFVPHARWREVWLLHNDPEVCLSIDAIADRLKYTRGSVAVILSRVRARIRDVA